MTLKASYIHSSVPLFKCEILIYLSTVTYPRVQNVKIDKISCFMYTRVIIDTNFASHSS